MPSRHSTGVNYQPWENRFKPAHMDDAELPSPGRVEICGQLRGTAIQPRPMEMTGTPPFCRVGDRPADSRASLRPFVGCRRKSNLSSSATGGFSDNLLRIPKHARVFETLQRRSGVAGREAQAFAMGANIGRPKAIRVKDPRRLVCLLFTLQTAHINSGRRQEATGRSTHRVQRHQRADVIPC